MGSLLYFLIFAGLFALMMRSGCGAHVMGHRGHPTSGHGSAPVPPEKVKDPVCGMMVETATAKTAVHGGTIYYFCSTDCREKFEASPEKYAGAASNPPPGAQTHMSHHG